MEIKKGNRFRCIKDVIYTGGDAPRFWYFKGKIYKSDYDGCITDEEGDIDHEWGKHLDNHFIPYISNKRKGYGRKAR